MKIGNSPLLAIQRAGLGNGANQKKGAGLARLLMVLGLLLLASPAMALGAPPEGYGAPSFADSVDPARVAAVIRFYTDRNERLDNSHSESYRAMAAYLSKGPLSGEFGSAADPDRLAAVLRFYTDPYEGGVSARDSQSLALTKALRGIERARFEGQQVVASEDSARLAAVIRFYTDRNERLDNSHSESYRAMAAYLSEGPLSGEFGSATDPARLAAVLRFYTDPYEGGDSARDPQSLALTKVLGGFKPSRAAVEALACTNNGIPDQLCSAETFGGTP